MPPSHEVLTDDYVAELLSKEANDCSLKYSAMGLDAFKSNKRPANQPKPNTRFLNNIIRDTNSHNRALLARENAESQARLRDLEEADRQKRDEDERKKRRSKPGPGDTRKRMLGDIAAILGGPSKKRRLNEGDSKATDVAADRDELDSTKDRDRRRRHRDDGSKSKSRSRKDDRHADSPDRHRHSHRHEERRRHHRSRSPERREHRHREHRERSPREKGDDSRHRRRADKEDKHEPTASSSKLPDTDSDSDPLDDLIGPAPPSKSTIRRRGRGHNAATSGIDSRFAADYDPTIDVTPDPDEEGHDDWENAMEAFRDRQKWKQQGADRLRSAGFTEEQIRKWEKGDNKDESDVRWNKAGGVREWDRGKVLDEDGGVSPEAEYGRLKGT